MARYRSATVPLPQILFSPREAQLVSTLATVNGRHPEGEFSVDQGYACGLLLENGGNLRVLEGHRAEKSFSIKRAACWLMGQPQRSW